MSIFGNIMSAIFGQSAAPGAVIAGAKPGAPPATSGAAGARAPAQGSVDVEGVLTQLSSQKKEKLDWRHSIVDLMKVLDMDSSLAARKQLAQELHYSGDTSDSASMNIWLHKEVIKKLAANGGKVPADLLD